MEMKSLAGHNASDKLRASELDGRAEQMSLHNLESRSLSLS